MSMDIEGQRQEIVSLLSGEVQTEIYPRADTHDQVQDITKRLREEGHDLQAKLKIGGFTLEPIMHNEIEQSCETCMYYLVRRRFCELPELELPVEPEWSCRLWRI